MIFLRDRKLLFFKPRKTAGTSFEIALSRHAGPQDIVTPLVLGDELLRRKLGGHPPVNWADLDQEAAFEALIAQKAGDADTDQVLFSVKHARYVHHITPAKFAERAGEAELKEATVVTMARHPYEVLASQIRYFKRFQKRPESFEELAELYGDRFFTNLPYYHYKQRYLPRFVVRFERLEEDLDEFDREFGFDVASHFPETKMWDTGERPQARDLFTREQRQRCYARNRAIFELFGYEP